MAYFDNVLIVVLSRNGGEHFGELLSPDRDHLRGYHAASIILFSKKNQVNRSKLCCLDELLNRPWRHCDADTTRRSGACRVVAIVIKKMNNIYCIVSWRD